MKKVFLKFGSDGFKPSSIEGRTVSTNGEGEFNVPPMGANPPTGIGA